MIKLFTSYIRESIHEEEFRMKRTLEDIADEYVYYDQMLNYLKEELTNNDVKIIRFGYGDEYGYGYE